MRNFAKDALVMIGQHLTLTNIDSWFNPFTGFGTARDKTTHNSFEGSIRLPDMLLTDLYNNDFLARKVVSLPAAEMFREGYEITTTNPQAAVDVAKRLEELDFFSRYEDGERWGRLYGGGVLFIGANDGRPADQPLIPDLVTSVDFFDTFDRRRAWPWQYYQDPKAPKFGKPEVYALQSLTGGIGYVHESRLIIFRGAETDDYTRRLLNGWDFSILQNLLEPIQHFHEVFRASRIMMTDASQGVFKMKGLISMIAGGQRQQIETRAQMLDMGRSVARSIFLDADEGEDFTKIPTQFAGVSDQLIQASEMISAATGIPVLVLMGKTPSGLNASGDANVRIWYDSIKAYQNKKVVPKLVRVCGLVGRSLGYQGETYTVEPKALWQETPTENATRRKTVAETDQIYANIDVLTPEQIQSNRFRADGWNAETKIDPTDPPAPQAVTAPLPAAPKAPALPAAPVVPGPSDPSHSPAQEQPGAKP